jgi:hypothetical protein
LFSTGESMRMTGPASIWKSTVPSAVTPPVVVAVTLSW